MHWMDVLINGTPVQGSPVTFKTVTGSADAARSYLTLPDGPLYADVNGTQVHSARSPPPRGAHHTWAHRRGPPSHVETGAAGLTWPTRQRSDGGGP